MQVAADLDARANPADHGEAVSCSGTEFSAVWGPVDAQQPTGMVCADRASVGFPASALAAVPKRAESLVRVADASEWFVEDVASGSGWVRLTVVRVHRPVPRLGRGR